MSRRGETRDVERAFGRVRLAAAHSFLRQAELTAGNVTDASDRGAAVSSAILAAIAAADAACSLRLGQVWKGEHAQAHSLLRKLTGAAQAANALQRVVSLKANAQYLSETITEARMSAALHHAETVVQFADEVAAGG